MVLRFPAPILVLALAAVLGASPSCQFVTKNTEAGGARSSGSMGGGRGESDDEAGPSKLEKKQRALEQAEVELQLSKKKADDDMRSVRESLKDAERGLKLAEEKLELFRTRERALKLEQAELGLSRAQFSVEKKRQELEETIGHFEGDEYAQGARELVVYRERKGLELAEADLKLQERKLAMLAEHELPQRETALKRDVSKAKEARRKAKTKVDRQKLENKLSLMKREIAVSDLERELAKLAGTEAPEAPEADGSTPESDADASAPAGAE